MTTPFVFLATLLLTLTHCCAPATHAASVAFDWATVGNPGNADDTHGAGYGSVDYTYHISKTEVTNAQYTEFLNAIDPTAANLRGLFNTNMAGNFGGIEKTGTIDGSRYIAQAGRENNPVTYVSWYDSVRFINWLHNGQGAGDTETGAYTLANLFFGLSVTRNVNATYWLPSEDEWYKAAYYDPHKSGGAGYYDYAIGIDSPMVPVSDQPGDDPSAVNYFRDVATDIGFNDGYAVSGSTNYPSSESPFTDVGAYASAASPYGTYDQNGNAWEWTETITGRGRPLRSVRGGSWNSPIDFLAASFRNNGVASFDGSSVGFRVSSIPEPSTMLLELLASVGLLIRRRR